MGQGDLDEQTDYEKWLFREFPGVKQRMRGWIERECREFGDVTFSPYTGLEYVAEATCLPEFKHLFEERPCSRPSAKDDWIALAAYALMSLVQENFLVAYFQDGWPTYRIQDGRPAYRLHEPIVSMVRGLAGTDRIDELRSMPYGEYLRTPEWRIRRDMRRELAGNRCELCNGDKSLHVHHRTYERRGEERLADLIVLCADCHSKFHAIGNGAS